jgi:6-phosphogluconolactonase
MNRSPAVLIFPDIETLSRALAEAIADRARRARGAFHLALNGGGTPQTLFNLLGSAEYRDAEFWRDTHIWWGDERCVPPDQPGSSYKQAADAFLGAAAIPAGQVHRIKGELDPRAAAEDYASRLPEFAPAGARWLRFDLVLLGMGADGHTASLFPGQPAGDQATAALAVTARYEDRPANRVTLTPAVFNDARAVFFMAAGAAKADTLREVLEGAHQPDKYPAQRIRPVDGKVIWWVDEAAAGKLARLTA